MNSAENFDQELYAILVQMANEGINNAAKGIAGMVGEELEVSQPVVRQVPLVEMPDLLGGPEAEAVGIYLRASGKFSGQIMMIVPYVKALELVDLILCEPVGTTEQLGRMERSALAELGNLTGSFFLNALEHITGTHTRPSPPAVIVDMVGAILDIIIAHSDGLSETILMIQATFMRGGREVQANFWIIPDRSALEAIARGGRD